MRVVAWMFPLIWFPYIVFFADTSGFLLVFHVSMWMLTTAFLGANVKMRQDLKKMRENN